MDKSDTNAARQAIAKLYGILKRKPVTKAFAEEWVQYKCEEREVEDRRHDWNQKNMLSSHMDETPAYGMNVHGGSEVGKRRNGSSSNRSDPTTPR